jgi:hypothetical protein
MRKIQARSMPELVRKAKSLGIQPRLPTAVIAQRCRALARLDSGDDLWADGLVVFEDGKGLARREQFAARNVPAKTGGVILGFCALAKYCA